MTNNNNSQLSIDNFGFHTFCLTKSIEWNEYCRLKSFLFEDAKVDGYRCIPEGNRTTSLKFKSKGVYIILCDNGSDLPNIEIRVNPRVLTKEFTYKGIFNTELHSCHEVADELNLILQFIGSQYDFESMTLSRIDLCVNVEFEEKNEVKKYMKVIRAQEPLAFYERQRFDSSEANYKEKNKHSYRIASADIQITIYDKLFEMLEDKKIEAIGCEGLLRFEISLKRPEILKHIKDNDIQSNVELLQYCGDNSKTIFRSFMYRLFPCGRYYSYDIAIKKILQAKVKTKVLNRMKIFIAYASRNGTLEKAYSEFKRDYELKDTQINKIRIEFEKIDLNPITIPEKYLDYRLDLLSVHELLGFL